MTDDEPVLSFVKTGTFATFAVPKTFPSRISIQDTVVTLHADGRITGATSAELGDALAKMEGSGVGGIQAVVWLILRELQRQEAA